MKWANEIALKGIELVMVVDTLDAKADKGTQEFRMEKCMKCDRRTYDKFGNPKCGVCKCFLAIKVKSKVNRRISNMSETEITHCPDGKWNDEQLALFYNN